MSEAAQQIIAGRWHGQPAWCLDGDPEHRMMTKPVSYTRSDISDRHKRERDRLLEIWREYQTGGCTLIIFTLAMERAANECEG